MCLSVNLKLTERFKAICLEDPEGFVFRWKTLELTPKGNLISPIKTRYKWKKGVNKSSRRTIHLNSSEAFTVDKGIHVYNSRRKRLIWVSSDGKRIKGTFKLKCYHKHFVAKNIGESVYTQVFLDPEELKTSVEFLKEQRKIKKSSICNFI